MFPTDAVAFSNAHFGRGTGENYLNIGGCSGSESNLIDCPHNSITPCSRGHFDDAGVRCQGIFMHCSLLNVGLLLILVNASVTVYTWRHTSYWSL